MRANQVISPRCSFQFVHQQQIYKLMAANYFFRKYFPLLPDNTQGPNLELVFSRIEPKKKKKNLYIAAFTIHTNSDSETSICHKTCKLPYF